MCFTFLFHFILFSLLSVNKISNFSSLTVIYIEFQFVNRDSLSVYNVRYPRKNDISLFPSLSPKHPFVVPEFR